MRRKEGRTVATIVINVSVDADKVSADVLALHEALHEMALTVSGLITVETVVISSVLSDDEMLLIERKA